MARITIETTKLKTAYSAVSSYRSLMKYKMIAMNNEVANLSTHWQGDDYLSFKNRWDQIDNENSVHYNMSKQLKSYYDYLKYAEQEYKNAQSRAKFRARKLK